MSHDTEPTHQVSVPTPDAQELREQVFQKKSIFDKLGRKGIVAVAAGIVGGGAILGVGGAKIAQSLNHDTVPNNTDKTAEAGVLPGQVAETTPAQTPNPSEDPTNPANTITSSPETTQGSEQLDPTQLEIKAGLSDAELGQTLMQRLQAWENAGAPKALDPNDPFYKLGATVGRDGAATQIANQNSQTFADSLMSTGWQNDPLAVEFVDTMKVRNNSTILGANVALGKKEAPLVDTYAYDSAKPVELSPADSAVHFDRTLQVNYVWTNSKTGETGPMRATFGLVTENGQERIVEVHISTADTNQSVVG